jgi:hypothetical protein
MKTNHTLARISGITMALALLASLSIQVGGQEKGATRLLRLSGSSAPSKSEASSFKPMSCATCKDEFVKRVDWTARGANKPALLSAIHLCAGCATDHKVVGHGKAKVSVAAHRCARDGTEGLAGCNGTKSADGAKVR